MKPPLGTALRPMAAWFGTSVQHFSLDSLIPCLQLRSMLSLLYVHIVWTTRERAPLITRDVEEFLRRFLPAIARQERCAILELGIVRDHIHVLGLLHPTTSIPVLLQRLKGGSAVIAAREGVIKAGGLKWAKGYSIRSVSPKDLRLAQDYVRRQALHHPERAIA